MAENALFIYCYNIHILNNRNYFNYKHFANMKVNIYGNRLPKGHASEKC
jgi:glycosylphosphatidylinositol transamidase (GPIT) subunit GPI8